MSAQSVEIIYGERVVQATPANLVPGGMRVCAGRAVE